MSGSIAGRAVPGAAPKETFVAALSQALDAAGARDQAQHARILGPLALAAMRFEIVTKQRLAHWLAQLGHESADFKRTSENLNYTDPARIAEVFQTAFESYKKIDGKRVFDPEAIGRAQPYVRQPEALANLVYASRNGNGGVASGDGWAYRGRGFIQLTGRANYRAAGAGLGLPLESNPDSVAAPNTGALTAGWFWGVNDLNRAADRGAAGLDDIRRRVNGPAKAGIDDCRRRFDAALAALDPWPEILEV
jgi:putative chitinase